MKITFETVREFARKHGQVTFWTKEKNSLIIGGNTPDAFQIVETAPTISYQGRDYTREEFEKLISDSD